MKLYKVLGEGREAYHGGTGAWPAPGEWLAVDGPLVLCENGLHLCRAKDLVHWLGPEIWEAEYEGEVVEGDDKVVVRKARLVRKCERWDERTARLFACDCAERALPIYEKRCPGDDRPRKAIETARRYANGEATAKELAAAWDAVWAAGAAVWSAARAAWSAARAAGAAAWAAVRATASDAVWAAAGAVWAATRAAEPAAGTATRAAERKWQTERLMEYLDGTAGQGGTK
jgi:hypothetical protein